MCFPSHLILVISEEGRDEESDRLMYSMIGIVLEWPTYSGRGTPNTGYKAGWGIIVAVRLPSTLSYYIEQSHILVVEKRCGVERQSTKIYLLDRFHPLPWWIDCSSSSSIKTRSTSEERSCDR